MGATLNRRTKPDAIAVAPPKRLDDNKIDEQPGMFNDEDVDDTNGHTLGVTPGDGWRACLVSENS